MVLARSLLLEAGLMDWCSVVPDGSAASQMCRWAFATFSLPSPGSPTPYSFVQHPLPTRRLAAPLVSQEPNHFPLYFWREEIGS